MGGVDEGNLLVMDVERYILTRQVVVVEIKLFLWRCRFFRVLCTIDVSFLNGDDVVRFLPDGVFYLVTTGWFFYISFCENSIQ